MEPQTKVDAIIDKLEQRLSHNNNNVGAGVRRKYEGIKRKSQEIAEDSFEIGKTLLAMKRRLGHGLFLDWVEDHCQPISERMAQHFMNFAMAELALPADEQKRHLRGVRSVRRMITVGADYKRSLKGETGEKPPTPARPASRRKDNECSFRGCVRPATALVYCGDHMKDAFEDWLGDRTREELNSLNLEIARLIDEAEG